jgi:outer membrane receptor protein involved in Fe transport
MEKRFLLLAIGFFFVNIILYSQPPRGNMAQGGMPKESKITGKIIDQATSAPVEYATIGIFSLRDSSLVSGGITDATGAFSIGELPFGRFYADISFVGYKKSRINNIGLNPNQKIANLGEIKLESSATALSEVEVLGNKNPIEYRIDKKVISVSQNVVASGGTAVDVLENTPSVQVDIEGNVSLRGSSNFTVLIDGKPSILSGSEALQQIPASTIQNIEIITNPSAKYDPSGSAGIINVILKKSKQAGLNGIINTNVSTNGSYGGDFLVNLRKNKLNFMLGVDYNQRIFRMNRFVEQEYFGDTLFYEGSTANGKFDRGGSGVKGGIDYYFNDKNILTLSASLRKHEFNRKFSALNIDSVYSIYKPVRFYTNNSGSKGTRDFYELNLDHIYKFNENGHQLVTSARYSDESSHDEDDLEEVDTDIFWLNKNEATKYEQNTTENETEKEIRFKTDYTLPINEKTRLEAGYQYELESSDVDYHFYNKEALNLLEDTSKRNDKDYSEAVHSIYSTFASSTKFFDYQLGLRVEYMDRKLVQNIQNASYPYSMWDYFPTVHLSKKLPWNLQIQASYTKRINRPGDRDLDPLIFFMEKDKVRTGNPALKPEYTNSYELNFQKSFNEAGFISVEGFHKQSNNLISRWIDYRDLIVEGDTINAMVMTSKNINKDFSTGGELMVNMPLAKWWILNSSASLYHYKLNGDSVKTSLNWNARVSSMFRFKWGMQLQITGFYDAPSITAQGERKGFYFTNIGLRQDFLKRKATVALQIRDLFGNSKFENTLKSGNTEIFSQFKRESRVFTISLTYRINNYKQQQRREQQNQQMNETDFDGGGGMM